MSFSILGIGTAVPPHAMSQAAAADLARQVICQSEQQARLLKVLYQKAGVANRYTVLPHEIALNWIPPKPEGSTQATVAPTFGPTTGERMQFFAEHATSLALRAAQRALEVGGMEARRVTHLVTVSCTGFSSPGVDIDLVRGLGLRPSTQRVQVGFMGCHGAINGLRVAQALVADPRACVLLCAVELCSLHYRFHWDPDRIVANALFADGAAAVVGRGETSESASGWSVAATGSGLLPDSLDVMTWRIGDHGFEMTLTARAPDLIQKHLRPWLSEWLGEHNLRIEEIGSWAIHPGGPRILQACRDSIGLTREQTIVSEEILAEYGNMSSPTILFIVNRLIQRQAARPCVSLAFGPGLAVEAALFR